MRIPQSKIELAVSTDHSRYTLQAVQLDVENKRFVATDGHIAAVVPAEVDAEDHTALIGLDAMKQLRAIAKQDKPAEPKVRTNGKITVESLSCRTELCLETGQFPRIDMVKPSFEGPATITVDAALLLRLARALDEYATPSKAVVSLYVKDSNSSIGVKVGNNKDAWGVIMPCRQ